MEIRCTVVYLDDGECYKVIIPTLDEKVARNYVVGNGDVVACKQTTYYINLRHPSDDDITILNRLVEISGIKND